MNDFIYPQVTPQIINMQDILATMQWKYALVLAICSTFIFVYIMMNIFVSNFNEWKWKKDFDDVVILSSVFNLVIALTYLTGFKGV